MADSDILIGFFETDPLALIGALFSSTLTELFSFLVLMY